MDRFVVLWRAIWSTPIWSKLMLVLAATNAPYQSAHFVSVLKLGLV
jgi:hypothetical protein